MPRLTDGHSTIMLVAPQAGILFFEIEVTPPGLDGGGPNDTTTMRNTTWRTRQPKKLVTMTGLTIKASYDPQMYSTIVANLNVNQPLTLQFPNGANIVFYGWIDKFTPDPHREGEQPTATIMVEPSNQNEVGVETAPVYNAAAQFGGNN